MICSLVLCICSQKFESTTLLIEYEPFMKFESNNAEFIRILYEFLTDWKKWLSSNFKMLC